MAALFRPYYIASSIFFICGISNMYSVYSAADYQKLDCKFDQRDALDVLIDGFITLGERLFRFSSNVAFEKISVKVMYNVDKEVKTSENECETLSKQLNMAVVSLLSSLSLALLGCSN